MTREHCVEHRPAIAFEAYLAVEQSSERPHGWVAGRVYSMSCGTERHDRLAGLSYEALVPAARRSGCRPFAHIRLARIGSAAYYPDVLIVCPQAQRPHRLYERDLSIVVEVLSPSSREADYREKVTVYTAADAFEVYLVADPDKPALDACTRGRDGLVWSGRPT